MAGRRWGKTEFAIWRLIKSTVKPNSVNWFVAPTRVQAKEIVWNRLATIFPRKAIARINETELFLDVRGTGARIAVKGADHEDGLLGSGIDELIIDEAQDIKAHVWPRVLRPMLVGRNGRCTMIGTKRPRNWFRNIWRDVHFGRMPPGYISVHFPSTANPLVSAEEWQRVRKEVGDDVWEREFVSDPLTDDGASEQIKYSEFTRQDHLISYFEIPETWRKFRFIDWGHSHPSACLWATLSPNGNIYIYDELEIRGKSPEATADLIQQKTGKQSISASILDPSCWRSEAGDISVGERMNKILKDVRQGKREDRSGGSATVVKYYLRPLTGKPKLYIFPHCMKLIEELENLCWDDDVKDDFTDALRYGVVFLKGINPNNFSLSDNIVNDGIKLIDDLKITYKEGRILKVEPLKSLRRIENVSFNAFGEPI